MIGGGVGEIRGGKLGTLRGEKAGEVRVGELKTRGSR